MLEGNNNYEVVGDNISQTINKVFPDKAQLNNHFVRH